MVQLRTHTLRDLIETSVNLTSTPQPPETAPQMPGLDCAPDVRECREFVEDLLLAVRRSEYLLWRLSYYHGSASELHTRQTQVERQGSELNAMVAELRKLVQKFILIKHLTEAEHNELQRARTRLRDNDNRIALAGANLDCGRF